MNKINPCLWFDGKAEEAAKFYTSIFKNSKIGKVARYGKSGSDVSGQELGSVMTVDFEIAGLKVLGLNGGPEFRFTQAVSFLVHCETEQEAEELWEKLNGGKVYFELQKYPWSDKYGWCEDKFGVSWQIMLGKGSQKITPDFLFTGKLFGRGNEALEFYQSIFKTSKVEVLHKDPKDNHIAFATISLEGMRFALMEGPNKEGPEITLAISFIINCNDQKEVDYYWDNLAKDGGEHSQCGWLKDKFGFWWQITPTILGELTSGSDPRKAENVFKEMLTMKKLDIAKLKAAYK